MNSVRALNTALVLAFIFPVIAQGESPFPGGPYVIVARHSGMGIEVQNAGGEQALLHTAGIGGQPSREFNIQSAGDGYYTIAAKHSGLTLEVRDAATKSMNSPSLGELGPLVQTAGQGGHAHQKFAITPVSGGYHKISARHSGLSLDVRDARGEGCLIQTVGDGGQAGREWLIVPVKSVASKAYARKPGVPPQAPDLVTLLTRTSLTFTADAPVSSQETCAIDVMVRNLKFGKAVIAPGTQELALELSGDVGPFAVVYTTDTYGPPLTLGGKSLDRTIMYPIQLSLLIPEAKITGAVKTDGKKFKGSFNFAANGLLAVGTPAYAGIPIPRGDNDPRDGLVGWEYKTWDKPFNGVRQPRRDDIKGAPEFIRANAGPLNFYVFLRPKAHPFKFAGEVVVDGHDTTLKTASFKFDRPFVQCPEDFKKAWRERVDWDYAVEASGPFAGLVQDCVAEEIVSTFTRETSRPFTVHLNQ